MSERITDELRDKVEATISAGITDTATKSLKKKVDEILYEIESNIMYRLKDDLAPNLAAFVVDMAERSVKAIIDGNESEMRRYLHCQESGYTGRHDQNGWIRREISEQHPIIHGALHENECVRIRRQIVEAHRDLIESQRTLDLEDQVASLVAQYNKLEQRNHQLLNERSSWAA